MHLLPPLWEAAGSWNHFRLCISNPLLLCGQGKDERMLALCVSRSSQGSWSNRHSSHRGGDGLGSQNKCLTISCNTPPTTSGYIISIAAVLNISFVPDNFPCIFQTEFTFFFFLLQIITDGCSGISKYLPRFPQLLRDTGNIQAQSTNTNLLPWIPWGTVCHKLKSQTAFWWSQISFQAEQQALGRALVLVGYSWISVFNSWDKHGCGLTR